jgi:DtxR family Mn-dependent transcriptional regulator
MPTATAENYLKQLYHQQHAASGKLVLMGQLAAAMGVTPGTATTMVKSFTRSGWTVYEPRTGVRLTRRGERLALSVVRRHRLLELFLSKVLGLDWSEVHEEAELLEHAVSDKVLEKIDELLGRPLVDPHGDPIPTASGTLPKPLASTLADCHLDQPVHVVRIMGADQDRDFLHFLDRNGLIPGAIVTVRQRHPAAQALQIDVVGHASIALGMTAAKRILVKPRRAQPRNFPIRSAGSDPAI